MGINARAGLAGIVFQKRLLEDAARARGAAHDLQHLNVGDVAQTDADTITADLVTENGSLALRLEVDPHTGALKRIE